jgi:hypothetical protein
MPTVKVLTKHALLRLNRKAIRANANRSIKLSALGPLSVNDVYPVSSAVVHNDMDIRARIILNDRGLAVELDMTLNDYNAIPTVAIPDHEKETTL